MSTTPTTSNSIDFNATAAAVAARISSSSEEQSPAEVLAKSLTLDSPKIDTAVRAFLSLVAARSITATETELSGSTTAAASDGSAKKCYFHKEGGKDPNMESLRCARALLKAMNSLTLPEPIKSGGEENSKDQDDSEWVERKVVGIVWNALVSKGQKPSKMFGRRALRSAYPIILGRVQQDKAMAEHDDASILPGGVDPSCSVAFFEEFGALLSPRDNLGVQGNESKEDDDHFLLWDEDGGAAELQRRRDRRVKRGRDAATAAESRVQDALSSTVSPSLLESGEASHPGASSVTIEEIVEEEEGNE